MILFSGALLLTPGFFTDAVGFSLLVPGIRLAVFRYIRARVKVQSFTMGQAGGQMGGSYGMGSGPRNAGTGSTSGDVIDGDFEEVPPTKQPTHGSSGWTKH